MFHVEAIHLNFAQLILFSVKIKALFYNIMFLYHSKYRINLNTVFSWGQLTNGQPIKDDVIHGLSGAL